MYTVYGLNYCMFESSKRRYRHIFLHSYAFNKITCHIPPVGFAFMTVELLPNFDSNKAILFKNP